MALVGSGAIGVVMGWLVVLAHAPVGMTSGATWRLAAFGLGGWVSSSVVVWYFAGEAGIPCVVTGILVGVATAAKVRSRV